MTKDRDTKKVIEEMVEEFSNGKKFSHIPASTIVDWAERFWNEKEKNKKKNDEEKMDVLNSTQMRKFYDVLRGIWDNQTVKKYGKDQKLDDIFLARLIFLRPHLAHAANKKKIPEDFKDIMELSIQHIDTKNDLYKFVKFFEAIIAYSK